MRLHRPTVLAFTGAPWFPRRHRALLVLAVSSVASTLADAQLVRGTVTEVSSSRPLAGVLITVSGGAMAAGDTAFVVSNATGQFVVRLPAAGSYSLGFKRIGVARRLVSLQVADGETRQVDVTLDPVAAVLSTTTVVATNLCLDRPAQLSAIASLWEEVRTVLRAAEATATELRVAGSRTTYRRVLQPRNVNDGADLPILSDTRLVETGEWSGTWQSVGAEELSGTGFWTGRDSTSVRYHAPDAVVLLSPDFMREHCFNLVQGRGDRAGLTGIEFRPQREWIRERRISGTVWLDARTWELRQVDFRYLNLPTLQNAQQLGGEVHFVRHSSGGWVIQRWFVRMPDYAAGSRWLHRIIEGGGNFHAAELESSESRATVSGVVLDSLGERPLYGARVRMPGTPFSVATDSQGAFRFDSVVPGAHVLLVENPDYDALGLPAVERPFNLKAGAAYRERLRASRNDELRTATCKGTTLEPFEVAVRVRLHHGDGSPAANRMVWLKWDYPDQRVPITVLDRGLAIDLMRAGFTPRFGSGERTDSLGFVSFCGVPPGRPVILYVERNSDDPAPDLANADPIANWSFERGRFVLRSVEVARSRPPGREPNAATSSPAEAPAPPRGAQSSPAPARPAAPSGP